MPAANPRVTEAQVWALLREIPDPEIPTISLVDLGVIRKVEVGEVIRVEFLPTFVGCPALDMMQREIRAKLEPLGPVEVKVVYDEAWTTERISEAGRAKLLEAGLAPPPPGDLMELPMAQAPVACPYCGSTNTQLENRFGPTPCRAIHYCNDCHQPFEQFKAV
ncbi:1,2-phenylacetyl-CoA epoxidase subunit PaaD [Marinithermus hydrothermalis]|uniref:Phenylacetate-CoA oxygenase, PaaJ subunit n=1 Tax=Marinithermus hydrothermalis (strain DSM 14884 / JCM 11576 / T1) TaxID=869210 RepID=F2NLK5_MARHT|nr:1,2-phenylacetyl-CoA epoxidase subunit PaaD [Marinithermus hydrothermalis]AEB12104.1 phenylacetate-CoA oxygenase, PaaJ subunit [Marinithermus hydrothermalis DSM 14884]